MSPDPVVARATLARIRALAEERPLVYLPFHDPEAAARLANRSVLDPASASPLDTALPIAARTPSSRMPAATTPASAR